jgi:hypothetical protein
VEPTHLYLDTARLGQMSHRAEQAHVDFARFAGKKGASPLFERFLQEGSSSWPEAVRSRYPGLACWEGIASLKESLRTLAGSSPTLPVLIANRLTNLMQFATRMLFHPCRHIMVTDLDWPPYRAILETEARRADRLMTMVSVRSLLANTQTTENEIVDALKQRFQQSDCDGLFLTAVSHQGIRFPVEKVVRALQQRILRLVSGRMSQVTARISSDGSWVLWPPPLS